MLCPNHDLFFSSFRIFRTSVPVLRGSPPHSDGGGGGRTLFRRVPLSPGPLECYIAQSPSRGLCGRAYTICLLPIFIKTRDRSATLPSNAKNDVFRRIEGDGGFIHPMLRWDKITPRNGDRRKTFRRSLLRFLSGRPGHPDRRSPKVPKGDGSRYRPSSPDLRFHLTDGIRSRFRIGILNGDRGAYLILSFNLP